MRVVFPWSTWAITATFRRRPGSRDPSETVEVAAAGAAAKAREKKREGEGAKGEEEEKDFLVDDQRERRRRGPAINHRGDYDAPPL